MISFRAERDIGGGEGERERERERGEMRAWSSTFCTKERREGWGGGGGGGGGVWGGLKVPPRGKFQS